MKIYLNQLLVFLTLGSIWYPALGGVLPVQILCFGALIMVDLATDTKLKMPDESKHLLKTLALYAMAGIIMFGYFRMYGSLVNQQGELFIFIMNFLFGPLVFIYLLSNAKLDGEKLALAIVLPTLFVVAVAIFSQAGLSLNAFDRNARLSLPFIANSIAATTLSIPVCYSFALATVFLRHKKVLYYTIAILTILILYLLATRFALISFVTVVIIEIFYGIRPNSWKTWLRLGAFSLMLIVAATQISSDSLNFRFLARLSSLQNSDTLMADQSLLTRLVLWSEAVTDISNNPWGYGFLTFVSNHGEKHSVLGFRGFNTHNEFLLMLVSVGWLVFGLFMFLLFKIFQLFIRIKKKKRLLIFLVVFLPTAFFDTYSNNPGSANLTPLMFATLALLLHFNETGQAAHNLKQAV